MRQRIEEVVIDLDLPRVDRWNPLIPYRNIAQRLFNDFAGQVGYQLNDLIHLDSVKKYAENNLPKWFVDASVTVGQILHMPMEQVILGNLYYDILQVNMGSGGFACSAAAISAEDGTVFHARNLDWCSSGNLLAEASIVLDYRRGGKTVYKVVGWPGYLGALSGMAPGKFSITLNSVHSGDTGTMRDTSISLLIKEVLENAVDFKEAVSILKRRRLMADCLLLVTGVDPSERIVIERTPVRSMTRTTNHESLPVAVTNDYQAFRGSTPAEDEDDERFADIYGTACCRFQRLSDLSQRDQNPTEATCLEHISDRSVMMCITAQQMVFNPARGTCVAYKVMGQGDHK